MNEYNYKYDSNDNNLSMTTDIETIEELVPLIDSLPNITSLSDTESGHGELELPQYMAPKSIEVRRYRLKK